MHGYFAVRHLHNSKTQQVIITGAFPRKFIMYGHHGDFRAILCPSDRIRIVLLYTTHIVVYSTCVYIERELYTDLLFK